MAWIWREERVEPGPVVVVDIDGVISDATHRQSFAKARDWDGFFAAAIDDPPIDSLIALIGLLTDDVCVVLLTARPAWLEEGTVRWLAAAGVRWDLLVMRDPGDLEPSDVFKRREIVRMREQGYDLLVALEDDLNNVRMLQEEGVLSVYIHSGYYED